jgi:hypothetical protein
MLQAVLHERCLNLRSRQQQTIVFSESGSWHELSALERLQ